MWQYEEVVRDEDELAPGGIFPLLALISLRGSFRGIVFA